MPSRAGGPQPARARRGAEWDPAAPLASPRLGPTSSCFATCAQGARAARPLCAGLSHGLPLLGPSAPSGIGSSGSWRHACPGPFFSGGSGGGRRDGLPVMGCRGGLPQLETKRAASKRPQVGWDSSSPPPPALGPGTWPNPSLAPPDVLRFSACGHRVLIPGTELRHEAPGSPVCGLTPHAGGWRRSRRKELIRSQKSSARKLGRFRTDEQAGRREENQPEPVSRAW